MAADPAIPRSLTLPQRGAVPAFPWRAGLGAISPFVLVGGVALVVLVASARATFLVPPAKTGFPHWMAGPLQGVFASFHPDRAQLKLEFTVGMGALYAAYLVALIAAPALRARWLVAAVVAAH